VIIGVSLFVFFGMLGATHASAQDQGPLVGTPPVLKATLLHEGRIEIAPTFGATLGDTYESHLLPGLNLTYFPLEWVGVGFDFQYGISSNTALHDQINGELRLKREAVCPEEALNALGEGKREECLDELGVDDTIGTRSIEMVTTAYLELVPFRGKAMFFGEVLRYDIHLLAGIGYATLRGEGGLESEGSLAPMAGLGSRWFMNDWITLVFQGRDMLLSYHPATDQNGRELPATYTNHFEILMGVGFVFPQAPAIQQ